MALILAHCLPDILKTRGLNIAPSLIVDDVVRLQKAATTSNDGLRLIGRRHIRDMNSWLHNINQYVRVKKPLHSDRQPR